MPSDKVLDLFNAYWRAANYLTVGQIDEIHLAMSPIFLGEGEHLFAGLNLHALGFTSIKTVASEKATHVLVKKR